MNSANKGDTRKIGKNLCQALCKLNCQLVGKALLPARPIICSYTAMESDISIFQGLYLFMDANEEPDSIYACYLVQFQGLDDGI